MSVMLHAYHHATSMPATVLASKDAISWHLPATPLVHCRRHAYVGALLIAGTLGYMAPQLPRRDSYGDLRPTTCPDIDMTLRRAFSLLRLAGTQDM